ncbi:MAG: formyltransferase family protein [Proteobacteria bacterium]|nr:formyltransferase family protein [Pseudomonadota bacterium]
MSTKKNTRTTRVILLTGDETRHQYFRKVIGGDQGIGVIASYCEGTEKSLEARVNSDSSSTITLKRHVEARNQSEYDFFHNSIQAITDQSNPIKIKKGDINSTEIINQIISLNPDILVCYGASLIKGELLRQFNGRFLNVHLGLSPYYRGSGTNVWPLINNEPEFVGATFMYIDEGIDTGDIIHQIRAKLYLGDGPHSIGNRLITEMCECYKKIIKNFPQLKKMTQPTKHNGKLYYVKDFTSDACASMYKKISEGLVENYLNNLSERNARAPIIENPKILEAT